MVGIERTVVPLIGSDEFHIESNTLITSFIISFGIVKGLFQPDLRPTRGHLGTQAHFDLGWLLGRRHLPILTSAKGQSVYYWLAQ